MPDPLVKKRKEMESDTTNKKIKVDTRSKNQEEILKSSTIPLWNTPYEQQVNEIMFFFDRCPAAAIF